LKLNLCSGHGKTHCYKPIHATTPSIILIFFNGLWAFLIFILSCVVIAVWSNTPEGKTLLRKQEVEAKAIREKRAVDAKRAEIAAAKVIEEFSTIV
jgi:hypothetical protein